MKLKKKNLIIILITIFVIVGVGFGISKVFSDKSPSTDKNPSGEKTDGSKKDPVTPEVQVVDLKSTSRPYAVMINNLSPARPYHSGLQEAYLVYEMVVEGGITRYLALFKDKSLDIVGPVRSSRHYYLDYALENDAYYIHWGWSKQAQNDISKLGINNLNGMVYGSPYFFRKQYGNVALEHTAYASLKELTSLAESRYRKETNKDLLLNYSATNINPDVKSNVANKIDIKNSGNFVTNYKYDEKSNTYKQYVNDAPHIDYQTKNQYTVKNIIAYQIKNYSIDSYGHQNLDNIGKGTGYFITGGNSYPITWEKKDRGSQTVYRYAETGEEITVNDGNTWIHLVPNSGSINIS